MIGRMDDFLVVLVFSTSGLQDICLNIFTMNIFLCMPFVNTFIFLSDFKHFERAQPSKLRGAKPVVLEFSCS